VSRFSESMRMSTQSEFVSGITILCTSLLMRAVSIVSPVGLFRDLLGILSVLFLVAGVGVVAVGLAHWVQRKPGESHVEPPSPMSSETALATGAAVGVAVGCTVGAMYGGALPVALGTAIGAAVGIAAASRWQTRAHGQR